jgi:hypothetical protein
VQYCRLVEVTHPFSALHLLAVHSIPLTRSQVQLFVRSSGSKGCLSLPQDYAHVLAVARQAAISLCRNCMTVAMYPPVAALLTVGFQFLCCENACDTDDQVPFISQAQSTWQASRFVT